MPGIPDFQYLRARYYAPHEGRFIQQDTLFGDVMVPLSQNLYVYAMNNPLSFIDPSGHYNIPLSIEMAGAYAVEMYLIKTGQKVPADKKIIQAEITNLEQVYSRASLSEKDAIKAKLDAKKVELDGNGGLYSIVGIEKISREFNAVYDPNIQIQGTAKGTAQPQMITVGEKEKWGWASKAVAEDWVKGFKSLFGAEYNEIIELDTGKIQPKIPLPIRGYNGSITSDSISSEGDSSKLFSVYANNVVNDYSSSNAGAIINIGSIHLDLTVGLDNTGIGITTDYKGYSYETELKVSVVDVAVALEMQTKKETGSKYEESYGGIEVNGWSAFALYYLLKTGTVPQRNAQQYQPAPAY